MNIIERLKQNTNLTNIEQEITHYILEHMDEVTSMSIQDLAKVTYSSNAAIIRLMKKLDCKGYKDFKIALVKSLSSKVKTDVDYNFPFKGNESTRNVARNMTDLTKNITDHVYDELDMNVLNDVAKVLNESEIIYYYGIGDSLIRAISFDNKMNKLSKRLMNTETYGDANTYTTFINTSDCALFVSYKGTSEQMLSHAKKISEKGVPIIVLTSNKHTPICKYASYIITIGEKQNEDAMGTFYSSIGFDYVLNILYALVYNMHYSTSLLNRKKVINAQKGK